MSAHSAAVGQVEVRAARAGAGGEAMHTDRVAVEAPLEIRIGKKATTVLMRTPGDDDELVTGFLFNEGLIGCAADIVALRRPEGLSGDRIGNVVEVELAGGRSLAPLERLFYGSSSCGVCGKNSIDALVVRAEPSLSRVAVRSGVLMDLPRTLRCAQATFEQTGGVHASGLFDESGAMIAVREDVGRHNALDKLIGWALVTGRVPLTRELLLVSGRVSYELMQKSIAAGLGLVAAVGAPSSLAVRLAEEFDVTLVGFLREGSLNVYASGHRVLEA